MNNADRAEYINHEGEAVPLKGGVFKTPFNHNTEAEAFRTGTFTTGETITQQHSKDEADINEIVRRFGVTGQIPQVPMPPTIDEFNEVFDFRTAMETINRAKRSFEALDPRVRGQFNNDPAAFVAYVDESVAKGDLEQLRLWGLAPPKPQPAPEGTPLGDEAPKT